jgi:hypothetical protein
MMNKYQLVVLVSFLEKSWATLKIQPTLISLTIQLKPSALNHHSLLRIVKLAEFLGVAPTKKLVKIKAYHYSIFCRSYL